MILNLRGTSGSGKSHLARALMARYSGREPVFVEGRKRPLLYRCSHPGHTPASFLGSYETPCGGCDTIVEGYDRIFELVRQEHAAGRHVVFEGLLLSPECRRTAALAAEGLPLLVLSLDVPAETCLASINARRRAKKPEAADVNPENTLSKIKQTARSVERLRAEGVDARLVSREEALAFALAALTAPPLAGVAMAPPEEPPTAPEPDQQPVQGELW